LVQVRSRHKRQSFPPCGGPLPFIPLLALSQLRYALKGNWLWRLIIAALVPRTAAIKHQSQTGGFSPDIGQN